MAGVRAARRQATRDSLVQHAGRLFAERGYDAVSLNEIVQATGVTKGALYHQFAGKQDLFEAVLADAQQAVGLAVAQAAEQHPDAWAGLVAGCHAFLDACTAPNVRQVLLVDGPAVVGWDTWRALDEQGAVRRLREGLADLMSQGVVREQPVEPLTRALSGAMNELALWSHGAPSEHASQAHDVLDDMLRILPRTPLATPTARTGSTPRTAADARPGRRPGQERTERRTRRPTQTT